MADPGGDRPEALQRLCWGLLKQGWKVNGIAKDSDVRTHSVGGSGGFGSGRRGSELGQSPDFQNRLRPSQ